MSTTKKHSAAEAREAAYVAAVKEQDLFDDSAYDQHNTAERILDAMNSFDIEWTAEEMAMHLHDCGFLKKVAVRYVASYLLRIEKRYEVAKAEVPTRMMKDKVEPPKDDLYQKAKELAGPVTTTSKKIDVDIDDLLGDDVAEAKIDIDIDDLLV